MGVLATSGSLGRHWGGGGDMVRKISELIEQWLQETEKWWASMRAVVAKREGEREKKAASATAALRGEKGKT